ncbi:hypothetical protein J2Z66_001728 [Paenibacillus eucommiae]|uniref:Uncharacterized protein n=1 Tax=Paenibacillus eucommiae TaxID=1355755 RepID=A0ABS4ISM3_9BACL|nr:hypothetical protein [Paenibacillus eucommiae]
MGIHRPAHVSDYIGDDSLLNIVLGQVLKPSGMNILEAWA